ncbi:MAG: FAD-binding oxidoreductase [Acidimicrobiia bacterium]
MNADVIVVGGGIAGVSAAAELSARASVVVVEAEPTLNYHASGRSAAMYSECRGSEAIRLLTQRSREFFVDEGVTSPRSVLYVAPYDEPDTIGSMLAEFGTLVPSLREVDRDEIVTICDAVRPETVSTGMLEPNAMELDVDLIASAFRRTARRNGAEMLLEQRVTRIDRDGEMWRVGTGADTHRAPVIVNAAGAWGDQVAGLAGIPPLGLAPLLRSVFLFDPRRDAGHWPLLVDTGERWYLKPEGPNVLGSAASETPSPPVDARPDELDIALGIERIGKTTDLSIRSVRSSWAGLRTFTPDRTPAVGFDPQVEGFFWLVGQGGSGIKTAPSLATYTASWILDGCPPAWDEADRLNGLVDPARFVDG